jgi:penicillin-binding protein 1A
MTAPPTGPDSSEAGGKAPTPQPAAELGPEADPTRAARRFTIVRLAQWVLALGVWAGLAAACVIGWYAYELPPIDDLMSSTRRPGVTVLASDGTVLATSGEYYGTPYAVQDLPPYLSAAVIAIEDRRFYDHFGVDLRGLARAMWVNVRAGHKVQGGSTITQQVAKNVFLTPERTLKRKIQEALLAVWLERRFTKAQILSIYLNRVYLGAGAYGVDAAAQRYFGKTAPEVSLHEAAVIAGLLRSPTHYSPARDPAASAARAHVVLVTMVDVGFITPEQQKQADAEMTTIAQAASPRPGPYFTDWVLDQLPSYVNVDRDLVIATTFDPAIQAQVDKTLAATLAADGPKRKATQAAAIVMSQDGAVRAMAGGPSYAQSQFNRATQSVRQPGSAFKLFTYLAALEAGDTPDTIVLDAPYTIGDWSPHNFEKGFRGEITLAEALAHSVNTAAARLIVEVGPKRAIQMARRLGISAPLANDATLALGSSGVSLIELTGAYASVANGGQGVWPYGISEIRDRSGNILWKRSGSGPVRVLDDQIVAEMDQMLQGVIDHGTAKAANFMPGLAGKTGTTSDFRDAWFIGYAGGLTTGVWVGNDDNSPMERETGGDMPAKAWRQIMQAAVKIPAAEAAVAPEPVSEPAEPVAQ